MTELTQISNKLDSFKVISKKTSKKITVDESEFYRFMSTLLEDSVSKIQQKIDKEKQTNKKLKFISHE
jgi:ferric iron reductase protein FhuF